MHHYYTTHLVQSGKTCPKILVQVIGVLQTLTSLHIFKQKQKQKKQHQANMNTVAHALLVLLAISQSELAHQFDPSNQYYALL